MSASISVMIVYMNDQKMFRQTLRNIRRIASPLCREIIVIDNNPKDGVVHLLKREFPEVRYVPMERNVGFGAGMNAGAKLASSDYLLVFNPDLNPEETSFEKLLEFLEQHPQAGIAAPQLRNGDGSVQFSVCRDPSPIIPLLRRTPLGKTTWGKRVISNFQMHNLDRSKPSMVDWAQGSSLLIARKFFEELGGFDEGFFMYYEDADLCRRVRASGKEVWYVPEARMIHYHRRASADGSLLRQMLNPLTWQHMRSAVRYANKYPKTRLPA